MKRLIAVFAILFLTVAFVFAGSSEESSNTLATSSAQTQSVVNSRDSVQYVGPNYYQQVPGYYPNGAVYYGDPNAQYAEPYGYYGAYGSPSYTAQGQQIVYPTNPYATYAAPSQMSDAAYAAFQTTQRYIDAGLKKNKANILQSASTLSMAQKNTLYGNNKKNTMAGFCLNFFLGFGIGSFVQGDMVAGSICLCGELIGTGLIAGGAVMQQNAGTSEAGIGGFIMLSVGTAIVLATRIYEWIAPFTYAKSYNRELSEAIFGSDTNAVLTTNVYPAVASNGNVGWGAGASVSF